MSLKDRLNSDLKTSMKAHDKVRTSVLRMLISEIKYAQAATNIHGEITESDVIKIVKTYHTRLVKSLEDYPEGEKRSALENEIALVEQYLPARASEDEVGAVVDRVLAGTTERNFGIVMKSVMAELGQSGDGKIVSKVVKEKLANA